MTSIRGALVAAVMALVAVVAGPAEAGPAEAGPAVAGPAQDSTDPSDSGASDSGASESGGTAAVELRDRSPWVDAGGTLTLDLEVGPDVEAVEVTVHGRLDSPDELATSMTEDEGPVIFTGIFGVAEATPLDGTPTKDDPDAQDPDAQDPDAQDPDTQNPDTGDPDTGDPATGGPAEASSPRKVRYMFDISATVNEGSIIRLAFAGVYPLVITPLDAAGSPGQEIRIPVIRRSGAGTTLVAPALSIVVDLSTAPTVGAAEGFRAFTAVELARFERLAALMERADPDTVPITVLANAQTVAALTRSSDPSAERIVAALSTPGVVVVPQPTVPLDWPVLAEAGLEGMLPDLIAHGRSVVDSLDVTVDTLTWDGRGGVDMASLEAIADAGYQRVLITPESDVVSGPGQDPGADATIVERDRTIADAPEDLAVLAVDEATSDALVTSVQGGDAPEVALADLLLRTPRSARQDSPSVAVAVSDAPTDSALLAVVDLIDESGSPVTAIPLDQGPSDQDDDPDDPDEPDGPDDPDEPDVATPVTPTSPDETQVSDLADLAPAITDALADLDLYASIAPEDDETAAQAQALIAASVQRGIDRADRKALIADASALTSSVGDTVHIVGPGDLNLTSRTGTLPIGVVNDGATPVTVVLAARSDRLAFPDDDTKTDGPVIEIAGQRWHTITLEVPPGEIRVDLSVEALASGSVPLFIELRDPSGAVVLDTRVFNVRSTAVSGVGLLISIGALIVLVVWWFRTWHKGRPQTSDGQHVTPDIEE